MGGFLGGLGGLLGGLFGGGGGVSPTPPWNPSGGNFPSWPTVAGNLGIPGTSGPQPPTLQGAGGLGSIFTPTNLVLLGTSLLSSLLNKPQGLTSEQKATQAAQQRALQQLLGSLSAKASGYPTIDPNIRSQLYGNVAQSAVGAMNRGQNALARRGMSNSGLTGQLISDVNKAQQSGQTAVDLGLHQEAAQTHQQDQAALLSALGIPMQVPQQGQSTGGAIAGGLGSTLAYLIALQNAVKRAGG